MTDVEVPPEPWPPWGETIAEESLINGVGSGDSNRSLGNNNITRSYDKPAGSLPKRVGGYLQPFVGPAAERSGHPGGETASLGYRSITYTTSENSQEIPSLSSIIHASRTGKYEGLYGSLFNRFEQWADVIENLHISIRSIQPGCKCVPGKSWGLTFTAIPCSTRFSFKRRIEKMAVIHKIVNFEIEEMGTKEFTLLTLTASHGGGWYETMERLRRGRDLLLKILRKYFRDIRFVWVGEPHPHSGKDIHLGYPHFHVVLSARVDNSVKDSQGRGLEDKLREYWSDEWGIGSHTYGLDFEVIDDGEKALNYLLKYVGKGYINKRGWSEAELIFNAHLYGAAHRKKKDEPVTGNPLEDNIKYRIFGMCNEYSKRFGLKKREPSVCLYSRIFPMETDHLEEDQKLPKEIWNRPQLIPDWLGNINLIESILGGSPDYTTRLKYDPRGKPLKRPSPHWGRELCTG